jgi:osmotically-inducible protein OsmY
MLAAALALGKATVGRADEPAGVQATVQDDAITNQIKSQFLASDDLRRVDISVTTKNGAVTLAGTVPSNDARREAVDMARHAGGVIRIDDQLRVIGSTPSDPEVPAR